MSERLPYEEQLPQQLRDFPVPDEDAAWADMKRRLEEDDDDGIIVWWKRGCAGWGLLLLGLIALGWWVLRDKGGKEEKGTIVNTVPAGKDTTADTGMQIQQGRIDTNYSQQKEKIDTMVYQPADSSVEQTIFTKDKHSSENISRAAIRKQPSGNNKQKRSGQIKTTLDNTNSSQTEQALPGEPPAPGEKVKTTGKSGSDSTIQQRAITFLTGDSVMRSNKDSINAIQKTDTAAGTAKKKNPKERKEFFFSAGLGLYQQIPIAGQNAVPYSSQGRQFSWADYIPSVYARLNKKDKWFIQGEFRYGAPQYNKPFVYYEKLDTNSTGDVRDTSKQLQKTYYHQLPLSFNYYVSSNWSVGAGVVWNKFSKSVYEESVQSPSAPPDSFLSKQIFTSKQPEAEGLSKSYFQGLLETQYQWRKFTFGARYTFGLAPYIKFTLPGEAEMKERNQSLQIFLRYQFLKLKGKRVKE
jgi:hypothetical protein